MNKLLTVDYFDLIVECVKKNDMKIKHTSPRVDSWAMYLGMHYRAKGVLHREKGMTEDVVKQINSRKSLKEEEWNARVNSSAVRCKVLPCQITSVQ